MDDLTPCFASGKLGLPGEEKEQLGGVFSVVSDTLTPWTAACRPLLLPSIFSSIGVFSSELALHIRWPKYWSFSFSISHSMSISG